MEEVFESKHVPTSTKLLRTTLDFKWEKEDLNKPMKN